MTPTKRATIAIVSSHPIQYYAPLFRELSRHADVTVFFAHRATPGDQANAGFGTSFEWDIDLTSGYRHQFLNNVAVEPGLDHFAGCDTPEIAILLSRAAFDAVLVMGWHLKCFVQAIVAAKRLRIPVLVRGDSHLETPRSGLKKLTKAAAYPVLLRTFDAVLYVGKRSRDYYLHYGYPARRLFHSPHCVDTARFAQGASLQAREELRHKRGITSGARAVLFAGKLVAFKRPLDCVDAVSVCRMNGLQAELVVAGDGELLAALVERAKEREVPVHILGFCNQSLMPAVYASADLLVLPSDGRETWGLVANEALACGRPVVLSDACGSAPDLAEDGEAGRIYRVGDVEGLSSAIRDIVASPPSANSILERSERHSLAAAAQGILTAAEFVTARRRPTEVRL